MSSQLHFSKSALILTIPFCAALMSCSTSQDPRFYVLSSVQIVQESIAVKQPSASIKNVTVGVGPVEIPRYLDRAPITIFTTDNRLQINEFERWAEPVADSVARAMARNLAAMTPATQVDVYPFMAGDNAVPDHRISIQILQFKVVETGSVDLLANWAVVSSQGIKPLSGTTQVRRESTGPEMEDKVRAMSEAVAQLSQDVAVALRSRIGN